MNANVYILGTELFRRVDHSLGDRIEEAVRALLKEGIKA